MDAEMEDELFKRTGFEMGFLNESIIRGKISEDEEFQKTAQELNVKLAASQ